jgi:hypothetical protein
MTQITDNTEMTSAATAPAQVCVLGNPGALRGRRVR